MPIRFACPACRQPLEVDDNWGGQSVACPYCRRVVTAPASSTWPGAEIPTATPLRPENQHWSGGMAPPPPPPGYPPQPPAAGRGSASGALVLTSFGALVTVLAWLAWMVKLTEMVISKVGERASQQEMSRVAQELLLAGQAPRSSTLTGMALLAAAASLIGVVLGVTSLVRGERGRGMAIAACIIGTLFVFCQLLLTAMLLGPHPKS